MIFLDTDTGTERRDEHKEYICNGSGSVMSHSGKIRWNKVPA